MSNYRLSADWRRIPLRQCQECPKLVPAAQERCNSPRTKGRTMTTRDELTDIIASNRNEYADKTADRILAAGYGKFSDRRPSVVADAANRVAYFLNWHQGDNDITADFPSGPSLYASDLQVILNELKAGSAK